MDTRTPEILTDPWSARASRRGTLVVRLLADRPVVERRGATEEGPDRNHSDTKVVKIKGT